MKGQETVVDLVDHTAQRSQHHDIVEQKENPRSGKYQHQTPSFTRNVERNNPTKHYTRNYSAEGMSSI